MLSKLNFKSEFVKYTVVLMSGTAIAQIISYFLAPVVSRLYTPEEAAELGLFLRIISAGAAVATLRYEAALPIIKGDAQSFRLYQFALRVTLVVTILSVVLIALPVLTSSSIYDVIFYALLPIALLFSAIYNIGTNWAIRNKQFQTISLAKISNSIVTGVGKVLFGLYNAGYIGLIIATTAGFVLSGVWFIRDFIRAKKKFKIVRKSPGNYVLAKQHKDYPLINLPHVAMDLGRDLLVAVVILELFSREDYGLYDHSYRMLRLPLVLAGAAIGQVFLQRCAEKVNAKEDILPIILRSIKVLSLISIIPFGIIFFYGEEIFGFVFGANWSKAGTYSEIMAPWLMVNFIASPISTLPLILKKQKVFFQIAIAGSVMLLLTLLVPPYVFNASIGTTLWIVSLSQMCYLVFVIFKKIQFAKSVND